MSERKNVIEFENGFNGIVHGAGADIQVKKDRIEPYDMTFGALASCFYSTFLSIAEKEGCSVHKAKITVTGEKRETVPTMLSRVHLEIILFSNEETEKLTACVKAASETCSMYQMISHVAQMSWNLQVIQH